MHDSNVISDCDDLCDCDLTPPVQKNAARLAASLGAAGAPACYYSALRRQAREGVLVGGQTAPLY